MGKLAEEECIPGIPLMLDRLTKFTDSFIHILSSSVPVSGSLPLAV